MEAQLETEITFCKRWIVRLMVERIALKDGKKLVAECDELPDKDIQSKMEQLDILKDTLIDTIVENEKLRLFKYARKR